MILREDDRPIRIRPTKLPIAHRDDAAWANAYRLVLHYARGMRKLRNRGASGKPSSKPHRQRCAVRVTYLNNRIAGQWKAHGRYLARESATARGTNAVGFGCDRSGIDLARELERWQSSGNPRIWKVILSPEFGERVDLPRLARDVVDRMSGDHGTPLEWIAVTHHNTEHAHVHMVIRGTRSDGQPLQFRPAYLKHGIREIAEDICTRQIGYRTSHDAAEAERREIGEHRFTSLDRAILRHSKPDAGQPNLAGFSVVKDLPSADSTRLMARLAVLGRMGLAEPAGPNTWKVRWNLEEILRAMQRTADRQKTLAAHGVLRSDHRLPIDVLDLTRTESVQGRILVHGQDEQSGRNYLMLEGTDAKIHFVQYTPEMELLRADGGLRTNAFLRLRKISKNGQVFIHMQDLGDSEKVLKNRALLGENARALLQRGIIPTEDGWGGWLGRYQAALSNVGREIASAGERRFVSRRASGLSRGL